MDRKTENFNTGVYPTEKMQAAPSFLAKGGVDTWFLLIVIAISLFGMIMSYSASSVYAEMYHDDSTYFFRKYVQFLVLAVLMTAPFVIFARPWHWRLFAMGAYCVSVLLLMLVPLIGDEYGGAKRWISFGPITIQPSEIAKVALVMMLALYMSRFERKVEDNGKTGFVYGAVIPLGMTGLLCVLTMLGRHISGLMIIGMLGIVLMFIGGTKSKWIFAFLGIIALAGVTLILLLPYAMDRVSTWINIEDADPLGSAWQTLQGLYAIGSGGLFGRGLGNSNQKYGYVSQPQNDFIFTIICEELGFIGVVIVIGLFALLVIRGFHIARNAPDKFCSLTCYGLTVKVALQTLMNIAVVTNMMPNTGIALPFFSSGGSALMLQIFEMGIILSISRYSNIKR